MGHRMRVFAAGLVAAMVSIAAPAAAALNVTNTGGFKDAALASTSGAPYLSYCGGPSQPSCPSGAPYQVRWGQPFGSGQSALGYTPAAASDVGAAPFVIGTLKHTNVPIAAGTQITSVKLGISTTVNDTTRSVTFNDAVTFTLNVDEVSNEPALCPGSPNPCPDFIKLPAGGVTFAAQDVGNVRYQLKIVGFQAAGGIVTTTMVSEENDSSSVHLVGEVTKTSLVDADAGPDQAVDEGQTVALDGSASQVTELDYTWAQTSGPSVTLVNPHAVHPTFTAPEVSADQTLTFRLTVADHLEPTYSDADTVDVLVRQVNKAPVVSAGTAYTGVEGSPVTLDGSASDADNDALALTWSYTSGAGADAGATCGFSNAATEDPTFTCTDDGTFTVKLKADDGHGGVTSSSQTVTLGNAAPELGSVSTSASGPIGIGATVHATAPFTEDGANDTHTCDVDWGDGTPVDSGSASSPCTGSHSYGSPGIYEVTVTVTDDDGDSDSATSDYVVVYDPSAGFVTGGGWIMSPAGAYLADPDLAGRANFGFVAKYQKGATTPAGETQFQFQAAGLSFHSTSYDWLVIAGAKAQYKGEGTLNGQGGYGFMLTARDGARSTTAVPDALRLKVWDKSTGTVVYDNQLGAPDTADAATTLESGSIVIHTK